MENIEIIPAILPKNFEELEQKLIWLKGAFLVLGDELGPTRPTLKGGSGRPFVQIDICDGRFVPSKTWPFTGEEQSISQLAVWADDFDFEIDLMVENPIELIEDWQKIERLNELSRSSIYRVVMHIENLVGEKSEDLAATAAKSSDFSPTSLTQFGIALNPNTPTEKIARYLSKIDFVQFMGINKIGYQGQAFNPEVVSKIQKFRAQNSNIIISIDGGVNLENIKDLIDAGVNRAVVGSAIFQSDNPNDMAKIIKALEEII
ncbi:MAG: hypothetical protein ABIG87_03000 [Patescibacteria group bacterium]